MNRYHRTNTPRVTNGLAREALESIGSLKSAINDLEQALKERKPRDPIAYAWIENAEKHFESAKVNICRINGAVLVIGTEQPEN